MVKIEGTLYGAKLHSRERCLRVVKIEGGNMGLIRLAKKEPGCDQIEGALYGAMLLSDVWVWSKQTRHYMGLSRLAEKDAWV